MKFQLKNIEFFTKKNNINIYYKYFYNFFRKNIKNKINLKNFIEICGTGGDKKSTFNISTSVFLIIILMKIPCYKLGSKKVTSSSGSSNFINKIFKKNIFNLKNLYSNAFYFLNIKKIIKKNIINKNLYKLRKEIKKTSIYNYIFSLILPFNSNIKYIGITNIKLIKNIFKNLLYNKIKKCAIVNSFDNMDEASIFSDNNMYEINKKKIIKSIFFLKKKKNIKNIIIKNTNDSLKIFFNAIKNKNKNAINIISLNCSFILYLLKYTRNINEGFLYVKSNFIKKKYYNLFKKFKNDIIKYNKK
ncbi:hypothetical protein [Candidatus Vidania fulgoroideorum]